MFRIFILLIFLAHGFVNLQRQLFINEAFSLLGGLVFAIIVFSNKMRKSRLDHVVSLLFFYGVFIAIIGFYANDAGSIYEKLRTLPILYSILCFYVGYYILYMGLQHFYRSQLYMPAVLSFAVLGALLGPKISYPAMLALASGGYRSTKLLLLSCLGFTSGMLMLKLFYLNDHHNDLTVLITLVLILCLYLFRARVYRLVAHPKAPFIVFLAILTTLLCIKVIHHSWSDFYYYGNDLFRQLTDPNTIWRLMFWAKTVGELQPHQWIFGIGLGTPIFDPQDPASTFIVMSDPHALHRPYTLGLHNSFITFFVRFGLVGIALLCYLVFAALRKLAAIKDVEADALMLSMLCMIVAALFNVVLESPLYSGIFWAILGGCYAKLYSRRHEVFSRA